MRTRIAALAAAAALMAAPGFPIDCNEGPGALDICVFDGTDFQRFMNTMTRGHVSAACGNIFGTYFNTACYPAGVTAGMESIIVGSQARARICKGSTYTGDCFDLTPGGWFNLGGWNNNVRSVRINWTEQSCNNGSGWPIWEGEVSIHTGTNQTGDCTTKDQRGIEFPHAGFMGLVNNSMRSARLGPFTQAVVCAGNSMSGTCDGGPNSVFFNASADPKNVNVPSKFFPPTIPRFPPPPDSRFGVSSIEIGLAPF